MKNLMCQLSNVSKNKIFDYLEDEYTSTYEKTYIFDNSGELREKWIGTNGETICTGVLSKIEEIKNEKKFPVFAHSHPTICSFSLADFFNVVFDEDIGPIPQIVSTKHINYIFCPKGDKYPFGKMKMFKYARDRAIYIYTDDAAKNLLKRKVFNGRDFPNTYKYFVWTYVSASLADFVDANFYVSPKTKKGFEYYKLMKKGVYALGGFDLDLLQ